MTQQDILSLETPVLLIDLQRINARHQEIAAAFGSKVEVFFAVKANSHPDVISAVGQNGSGFDVASFGEIIQVLTQGFSPGRVAFSNPVKIDRHIAQAYAVGVRLFAFDSVEELKKLSALAPGSSVYLRLAVPNDGSGWPLASKFGADPGDATYLLNLANRLGLKAEGLTFHVGSQCTNTDNWEQALKICSQVELAARKNGVNLTMLNLGGGLPAPYVPNTPSVQEAADIVDHHLVSDLTWAERIILEPGRYVVAEAGSIVSTVIGRSKRDGKMTVTLDVGLFNGLMEAYECFWYTVECYDADTGLLLQKEEEEEEVKLYGPTCDSVDVITDSISLPKLKVGDRVVFRNAGAYTNSYEHYNGFSHVLVQIA